MEGALERAVNAAEVVGKEQLDVGRTGEAERRINLVEDGVLVGNAGAVSRPKAARHACREQAARQPTQRRPARRCQPQSTQPQSTLHPDRRALMAMRGGGSRRRPRG